MQINARRYLKMDRMPTNEISHFQMNVGAKAARSYQTSSATLSNGWNTIFE